MQLNVSLLVVISAAGLCFASDANPVRLLTSAPLRFEPTDAASRSEAGFIARGAHFRFEFTPHQAILRSGNKDVRLSFEQANTWAHIDGQELLRSKTNLYFGNDPSKWRRNVPNYGRLKIDDLYPGINLAYYGNGSELEYDLTLKPGADPGAIRFRLDHDNARLNQQGDLLSSLIQRRPVAYQLASDGSRQTVTSSYRRNADGSYGFRLGAYDHSRILVIDPVVVVAQYFAGSYETVAYGIGHDSNGLVYIGGSTESPDLTLAGTPLQSTEGGGSDLFLAIVNPSLAAGSQIIYTTFIGGTGDDTLGGMAVGPAGDVYMTGATSSSNFPLQNGAQGVIAGTNGQPDAFVLWMNSSQSLAFSTFFGGSEQDNGTAIAPGANGLIWVAGNTQSADLPITGGFQSTLIGVQNIFVAAFNPANTGQAIEIYSMYIGGTVWDEAYGIVPAPDGSVWIAGGTYSPDIWIQGSSSQGQPYQGLYGGDGDGYIAHLNPSLGSDALLYSTFLGGSAADEATSLVLDPSGNVIVSGYTLSPDFPVSNNAFQTKYGGNTDAFVTVLNTLKGQLVYSTYFGGANSDSAMDLKEDASGALYVSGYTESPGLPATSGALQTAWDGSVDAFGLKLDPSKSGAAGIDYFTYLGSDGTQVAYGVDYDAGGNMYLAGYSSSAVLSPLGGPDRPNTAGTWDAFVVGFGLGSSTPAASTSSNRGVTHGIFHHISPHR